MTFEGIISKISEQFGEESFTELENCTPQGIEVKASDLKGIMTFLHDTEGLYFDSLSCLSGLDNEPDANSMEVVYNLYSIPYNQHFTVKVSLDREKPIVPSVESIWKTADWQEREAYDMFGIIFEGHPDLRRILLPADWEGFPLRKDYKHQEYYRGIKVEY